jgi:hypothetical protein
LTFNLLWRKDAVDTLLRSFLNVDGGVCMEGRKYAALALAHLCVDPTIRGHLLHVQAESLSGINLLEMIEWFLQDEVYHHK